MVRRGRSQARRFAQRAHQFRERQERLTRRAESEPHIVAHDPPHEYGCLVCFVGRQQERRMGGQP